MNDLPCQRLDEYLLGLMSDDESRQFSAHLEACLSCQSELETQKQVDESLAKLPAMIDVPDGLADVVRQPLGSDGPSPERLTKRGAHQSLFVPVAAAAVALVALIAIGRWLSSDHPPSVADRTKFANSKVESKGRSSVPEKTLGDTDEVSVHATFPDRQVVRAIESQNPRVSIYWVYPKVPSDTAHSTNPN